MNVQSFWIIPIIFMLFANIPMTHINYIPSLTYDSWSNMFDAITMSLILIAIISAIVGKILDKRKAYAITVVVTAIAAWINLYITYYTGNPTPFIQGLKQFIIDSGISSNIGQWPSIVNKPFNSPMLDGIYYIGLCVYVTMATVGIAVPSAIAKMLQNIKSIIKK